MLTVERLHELQADNAADNLGWGDLVEIEAAFNEIPDDQLRDLRENALVDDMLDELDTYLQPTNDVRVVAA